MNFAGMVLGQGAFGRVIKAEAIGIHDHEDVSIVAVKMVKGEYLTMINKTKTRPSLLCKIIFIKTI